MGRSPRDDNDVVDDMPYAFVNAMQNSQILRRPQDDIPRGILSLKEKPNAINLG